MKSAFAKKKKNKENEKEKNELQAENESITSQPSQCNALLYDGLNLVKCTNMTTVSYCQTHINQYKFKADKCHLCKENLS